MGEPPMPRKMSETPSKIPPSEPPDESRPFPPRFCWLKRLSLWGLLLLIALGGLRGWWGHESQRRINDLVAAAQARGEPILPEDFDSTDVPTSDDAAILYKQAERSLRFTQAENDFGAASPYSIADLRLVASMKSAHPTQLQLVRAARDRHEVDWGTRVRHPLLAWHWSNHLSDGRRLALLMKYVTTYEHCQGEDGNAVEDARDSLALANAHASAEPTLIGLLVAQGIASLGVETVVDMAPTLDILAPGTKSKHAATENQVRALINDLLDEDPFRRNATRAWMGERMLAIGTESELVQSEIHPSFVADFLWPAFQLQSQRSALSYEAMVTVFQQDNFADAMAKLPRGEKTDDRASILATLVRQDTMRNAQLDRLVQIPYQVSAKRRAAALLLAIRLYQADHANRLPETLAELVPAYLPAVPLDPFSPANHSFAYLPHRDPPAIYSVGFDGVDNGGSTKQIRSNYAAPWGGEDVVFPLRPASAATQPAGTADGKK